LRPGIPQADSSWKHPPCSLSLGAYPDFVPRGTVKIAYAPFFKERRMMFASATNFYRKSRVA
jgi:hypothetical protein